MKTLQARIEFALSHGLDAAQIAAAAKVSRSAVSQWKNGSVTSLKGQTAARLAALTGWSATWWATGEGPREVVKAPARLDPDASPFHAAEPSPAYDALSHALRVLGHALAADLEPDVRADVADALHKLALRAGSERDQRQILALLNEQSRKRQTAA